MFAAGERRIGCLGGGTGALEVAHHHRIKLAVERLDAGDEVVGQFQRGDFLRRQRRGQFPAAGKIQRVIAAVLARHDAILRPSRYRPLFP